MKIQVELELEELQMYLTIPTDRICDGCAAFKSILRLRNKTRCQKPDISVKSYRHQDPLDILVPAGGYSDKIETEPEAEVEMRHFVPVTYSSTSVRHMQ